MEGDKLLALLTWQFGEVQDLLEYAEAKNASLLVFNGTILGGIVYIFTEIHRTKFQNLARLCLVMVALTQAASFSIALYATQARTEIVQAAHELNDEPNLLFFAHIAQLSGPEYYDRLKQTYALPSISARAEADLALNVTQVSKIATVKFAFFNRAAPFNFLSFLILCFWAAMFAAAYGMMWAHRRRGA